MVNLGPQFCQINRHCRAPVPRPQAERPDPQVRVEPSPQPQPASEMEPHSWGEEARDRSICKSVLMWLLILLPGALLASGGPEPPDLVWACRTHPSGKESSTCSAHRLFLCLFPSSPLTLILPMSLSLLNFTAFMSLTQLPLNCKGPLTRSLLSRTIPQDYKCISPTYGLLSTIFCSLFY